MSLARGQSSARATQEQTGSAFLRGETPRVIAIMRPQVFPVIVGKAMIGTVPRLP